MPDDKQPTDEQIEEWIGFEGRIELKIDAILESLPAALHGYYESLDMLRQRGVDGPLE